MAERHKLGFTIKRKQMEYGQKQSQEECKSYVNEKHTCKQGLAEEQANLEIQAILDSIPAYVIIVDDTHRIIMANKTVKDAVGLDSNAINGAFCPKLMHGLTRPFHGCPLEDSKKTGKAVEKEVYDSDMGKWLRSTIYPMGVKTENNHQVYLHMVFDISDEKTVREERAELEKLLTNLLNSTDEGIYGVDADSKCIFANKATSRLTGYSIDELLGKDVDEIIRFDNSSDQAQNKHGSLSLEKLKSGKGFRIDDEIIYRKDGSNLRVEYSANPIVDGAEIEGAVVTFVDISERKRIENELRLSEKRFRAIVEQSNDGIIMQSQDGEITLYNASAETIFGYTAEEVSEKGLFN
ncbi:MAG: PAS domain S-box protein, partial [Rubrobacteridae bacterium]|nr:PAS domain S-box protein [Rubrobacteridae bacterium]